MGFSGAVLTFVGNAVWLVPVAVVTALILERAWSGVSGRDRSVLLLSAMFAAVVLPTLATGLTARAPVIPLAPTADVGVRPERAWDSPSDPRRIVAAPIPHDVAGVLAAGFLLFVAARLLWLQRSWRACSNLVRDARHATSARLAEAVHAWAARMGLAPPDIRLSDRTAAPLTLGIRRSVIVLPRAMEAADGAVLEAVVAHEMAHVRRHDFAWNLAAEIATSLVAFHPALWLLRRRLAVARETACDEQVCASGMPWRRYARVLLEVAASSLRTPRPGQAMGLWGGSLEERMVCLRDGGGRAPRASLARRLAAASALGSTVVAAAMFAVVIDAGRVEAAVSGAFAVLTGGEGALAELQVPSDEPPRYDPTGRRDPFARDVPVPPKGEGLARFRIDDVALRGIVATPAGRIALLWVPGQRTYFARVGQPFVDGRLVAIEADAVALRQEPGLAGAVREVRTVRLTLHEDAGRAETRR